jgi:hypothetical protein
MRKTALPALLIFGLSACGGGAPPPPTTPPPPPATVENGPATATVVAPPPTAPEAAAHKLFVETNACWFGGLWGDAERESPETRKAFTEARCTAVVRSIYGMQAEEKTRIEQLRAFESGIVGDLSAKIETFAAEDPKSAPRKALYAKLVSATAATQREATLARRAGDRVKRDLDHEPDKLTKDEADSVAPLVATKELEALLAMDAGELSADAHAIALIGAMERIYLSRGLPKHLKVYALSGTLKALFNAPVPTDMPSDATKPLKKGAYLAYVTDAAKAAGHPVSDVAKTPRHKEALAWSGVLKGVADKIKANAEKLSAGDLMEVSLRISNRLTAWYDAEEKAVAAQEQAAPAKPGAPPKKK